MIFPSVQIPRQGQFLWRVLEEICDHQPTQRLQPPPFWPGEQLILFFPVKIFERKKLVAVICLTWVCVAGIWKRKSVDYKANFIPSTSSWNKSYAISSDISTQCIHCQLLFVEKKQDKEKREVDWRFRYSISAVEWDMLTQFILVSAKMMGEIWI